MNLGNWQLDTVSGGDFLIDGGVVYGVVPKTVWGRIIPCDSSNRVRYANNCVLARDGDHIVLIDTGYGGKYPPLDRQVYGMEEGTPILRSLAALGVAPEDIDMVVLSHLHFDHAGGATSYDQNRRLVRTFPRATYVAGRFEWEDALTAAPELGPAYPQDNLTPLRDANCVELVDDGALIVAGLRAIRTGGHTRGHLALLLESGGEAALYIADLCPTTQHVRQLWGMAYDSFQLVVRRKKKRLLERAAANDWWLLWPHDPTTALGRLAIHPKHEFDIIDPRPSL